MSVEMPNTLAHVNKNNWFFFEEIEIEKSQSKIGSNSSKNHIKLSNLCKLRFSHHSTSLLSYLLDIFYCVKIVNFWKKSWNVSEKLKFSIHFWTLKSLKVKILKDFRTI